MVCVGALFAIAEVSTVALTRDLGHPDAASLVIAVYALGSFVIGVIMGGLNLRLALHRQLLIAVGALLVTTLPLLLADSVLTLTATIFLSGIAVSPTFITAFRLVEQRVPPDVLTEGVTWVGTGTGMGMALGAFASGWVVDTYGARSGFWVSVVIAMIAVAIIAAGQRSLAGDPLAQRAGQRHSEA
jgi:MFS family permease